MYNEHYKFLVFIIRMDVTSDITQDQILLLAIKMNNVVIAHKIPFIVRILSDQSLSSYNSWIVL